MLYQATEPSEDRSIDYKMPPNGYFIHYPMVYVHVAGGTIVFRCFGMKSYMKDTVGLERFLAETLAPTIQAHYKEAGDKLSLLYEELSGISKQEKV